jgi:hypothetical protein
MKKAIELANHVVEQMCDDERADFLEDPESWREGLSITYICNVSTGEQECDVDDLMDAITDLLKDSTQHEIRIAEIDGNEDGRQIVSWDAESGYLLFDGERDPNGAAYPSEIKARNAVHDLYRDWGIVWIEEES